MRILALFLLCMCFQVANAGTIKEVEGHIGMVSVSFAEIPSNLSGPNASDPASGSFSVIASSLSYHFLKFKKYSAYAGGVVPVLMTQGVGYLGTFVGGEYYLNDVAHMTHDTSSKFDVYIQPKLRYHLNVELGVNYLTYATEESKKSDISFGLGVGGGGSYTFADNWAAKMKVVASKDFGLITDALAIKIFLGGIFYLDL